MALLASSPSSSRLAALQMQPSRNRSVAVFAAVTQDAADEIFRIISDGERLTTRGPEIGAAANRA